MATPIPNTVEVRLNWSWDLMTWATNVLHYVVPASADVDQGVADAVAAAVQSAWDDATSTRSVVGNIVRLETVGVRDIRVANQPEFFGTVELAGTAAGNRMPRQSCVVATLRTALAGRSFRGRVYTGGYTVNSATSNGDIGISLQERVENFLSLLNSMTISGGLWVLGVTSRSLGVTTIVDRVEVRDDVWDWQRSRATLG